jgi:hypothetical protein
VSNKTLLFTSPNITSEQEADNKPLSRPTRQRRRAKADRGLPPDEELKALAVEYLKVQRKHWPDLVKAGLLPDATDAVLDAMVEDFKDRHRDGAVEPESVRVHVATGLLWRSVGRGAVELPRHRCRRFDVPMQNPGSVRGSQALSNLMQRLNDPGLVRPIQPCRGKWARA